MADNNFHIDAGDARWISNEKPEVGYEPHTSSDEWKPVPYSDPAEQTNRAAW